MQSKIRTLMAPAFATILFSLGLMPLAYANTILGIEEVIVTGKRPGPPLWKVFHGDNVLWIFGTLAPLPKQFDWDTSSVEYIMSESTELLLPPSHSARQAFLDTENLWLNNAINALKHNKSSFAYLPVSEIIGTTGLVARLRQELTNGNVTSSLP